MASSLGRKPYKYAELVSCRFLPNDNLYELTFNDIGYVGYSYFAHRKRQPHSIMHLILCEYIFRNNIFEKFFDNGDVIFPKGTISHQCHKMCNNFLQKFKVINDLCKICPNRLDVDEKIIL